MATPAMGTATSGAILSMGRSTGSPAGLINTEAENLHDRSARSSATAMNRNSDEVVGAGDQLRDRGRTLESFFGLTAAGPAFFLSAWLLMIFAEILSSDAGIRALGYMTSVVVTIGLWLTVARPSMPSPAPPRSVGL
jgi:hypothetical protein